MKFLEATGISGEIFNIALGFTQPADPKKETVKYRSFIDGDVSAINYGARKERLAEFTLINIEKSKFVTLANYLIENAGKKILIEVGEGENLFPDVTGGGSGQNEYYVYIIKPSSLQEEDFSITRELFSLKLEVALAGVGASSVVPNEKGSQQIDILIKIDTILADFIEDDSPGPTAEYVGQRWLDITSTPGTLKEWDGSSWRGLYQIVADDSDLGLKNGSFYLSAFADLDFTLDDGPLEQVERNFKSGLITFKGVSISGQSINISEGPSIARREGFTFSIDNSNKFWEIVVADKINLYGAKCTIWIYKDSAITKKCTGKNKTNDFSYTDYKFKVEPFMLDDESDFPKDIIRLKNADGSTNARYSNVRAEYIENAVYMTYGQHEVARLQNISSEDLPVEVFRITATRERGYYTTVMGVLQTSKTQIKINRSASNEINKYRISSADLDAINNEGYIYTIKIIADTNPTSQNNVGLVRTVVAPINEVSGEYIVNIDEELPIGPNNSKLTFVFNKLQLKFQIEGGVDADGSVRKCGGFGTVDGGGAFINKITLFALSESERDLVTIPSTDYTISDDGTTITLNPRGAADPSSITTYKEIKDDGRPLELNTVDVLGYWGVNFNDYMEPEIPPPTDVKNVFIPTAPAEFTPQQRAQFQSPANAENHFRFHRDYDDPKAPAESGAYLVQRTSGTSFVRSVFTNGRKETAGKNGMMVAVALKVNHTADEDTYLNSEEVRLVLNLGIQSTQRHTEAQGDITPARWKRQAPVGFTLLMRVKKYGVNNYVLNANWAKDVPGNKLDCAVGEIVREEADVKTLGEITIDNRPNTADGFRAEKNSIAEPGHDYQITFMGTEHNILSGSTSTVYGRVYGDLAWAVDSKKMYRKKYGINWEFAGQANPSPASTSLIDKILYFRSNVFALYVVLFHKLTATIMQTILSDKPYNFNIGQKIKIESATSEGNNGVFIVTSVNYDYNWIEYTNAAGVEEVGSGVTLCGVMTRMLKVVWPAGLEEATPGTDYVVAPTLYGRDMFDISELFGDTPQWQDVEQIELFIVNHDIRELPWVNEGDYANLWNVLLQVKGDTPAIYVTSQVDLTDKPLFASVQGRYNYEETLFMTSAQNIIKDILSIIYPNKYNEAAIDALFSEGIRAEWLFRRQFTDSAQAQDILLEILHNLWAVAIFDEEDNIVLKSLEDKGANDESLILLDDTKIIKDSLKKVSFRNANEIFQKFIIKYNFNMAYEVSKAQEDWRGTINISPTEGEASLKNLINNSKILYNLNNSKTLEYKYHYVAQNIESFIDQVVNFFAFNSWGFKLNVAIEDILGENAIKLMDIVRFKSSFFSSDEIFTAFVVYIKPNIYEGVAQLGLYIISPAGKLGPLCDLFNDALNVETRVIAGWTDGNGQRNDAGDVTTRTIGDYKQKDAGNVETRTFECV